jgi:hypothetical protein
MRPVEDKFWHCRVDKVTVLKAWTEKKTFSLSCSTYISLENIQNFSQNIVATVVLVLSAVSILACKCFTFYLNTPTFEILPARKNRFIYHSQLKTLFQIPFLNYSKFPCTHSFASAFRVIVACARVTCVIGVPCSTPIPAMSCSEINDKSPAMLMPQSLWDGCWERVVYKIIIDSMYQDY